MLAEIRKNIAELGDDARIRIESMAQTVRNVVNVGGDEGRYALALVGAELAAE
jgi:hypothetical protein